MAGRLRLTFIVICSVMIMSGCNGFKAWWAKEFKQDQVSDGIARLSAQPMAMIVSELTDKFASPDASMEIIRFDDPNDHSQYGRGEVTWTLKDVLIDHPNEKEVYKDCQGMKATWQGKAHIISATRTMRGRLTNDPKKPVLPDPGTVKIKVEARAENLTIKFAGKPGYLEIQEGELKFTALPRLAQSHTGNMAGLRIVPTSNTRFEDVRLTNILGMLMSDQVNLPFTIEDSDFYMQIGIGDNDEENVVAGKISIFGNEREVPTDRKGLDPNYDREAFTQTFSCEPGLGGKITYGHEPIETKLAPGFAGLTALVTGLVVGELEENTLCGMASPGVLKDTSISAPAGLLGQAVNKISEPCVIDFADHQTEPDCFGNAYLINGSVSVIEAKKSLSGLVIVSKDGYQKSVDRYKTNLQKSTDKRSLAKKKPALIIPNSTRSAEVEIDAIFQEISLKKLCLNVGNTDHEKHCQKLAEAGTPDLFTYKIKSGKTKATFKPVLAKQLDPTHPTAGFCSVKVPISEAALTITGLKASLDRGGADFHVHADGDYEMVTGKIGDRENELRGNITVGGVPVAFSSQDRTHSQLDPDYVREHFDDSYLSCQNIVVPVSDHACAPEQALATNVARLVVLNAGSLLKAASSRDVDGSFASRYAIGSVVVTDRTTNMATNKVTMTVTMKADRAKQLHIDASVAKDLRMTADNLGNKIEMAGTIESFKGETVRTGQELNKARTFMGLNFNLKSTIYVQAALAYLNDSKEFLVRPTSPTSTSIELQTAVSNFATQYLKHGKEEAEPYLNFETGTFEIEAVPIMGIDKRTAKKPDDIHSYSIQTPIVEFKRIGLKDAKLVFLGDALGLPLYVSEAELRAFNGRYDNQGNYIEGTIRLAVVREGSLPPAFIPEIKIAAGEPLVPDYDQARFDRSYALTPNLKEVLSSQ